jgi:hypothetical protein
MLHRTRHLLGGGAWARRFVSDWWACDSKAGDRGGCSAANATAPLAARPAVAAGGGGGGGGGGGSSNGAAGGGSASGGTSISMSSSSSSSGSSGTGGAAAASQPMEVSAAVSVGGAGVLVQIAERAFNPQG